MLTRLDAEERLAGIDTSAVAFGSVDAKVADRVLSSLRTARDGTAAVKPRATKARPEDLAAMGIGLVAPVEAVQHV